MSESNTGYRPLPPLATPPTIDDVKRLYAQPVIEVWHPEYMQVVLEVLAATERERDEARDQANRLRGIYGDILSRAESLGWRRPTLAINSFQSVLSWMADNAERAKERDALRAELEEVRQKARVTDALDRLARIEEHRLDALHVENKRLKMIVDEAYRVDGRLTPDYERGWNDAVTHIRKTISDGKEVRDEDRVDG